MSIRSDVGLVIRREWIQALLVKVKAENNVRDEVTLWGWLAGQTSKHDCKDGAELFILTDVKWSLGHSNVSALYKALESMPEDDFLIVEACHDYPATDSEYDGGNWLENPWGLRKQVSVQLVHE